MIVQPVRNKSEFTITLSTFDLMRIHNSIDDVYIKQVIKNALYKCVDEEEIKMHFNITVEEYWKKAGLTE